MKFSSRGGLDALDNLCTACRAHHLKGIHEGHIEVTGRAPHDLTWRLGVMPYGTALLEVGPGEKILGPPRVPRKSPLLDVWKHAPPVVPRRLP